MGVLKTFARLLVLGSVIQAVIQNKYACDPKLCSDICGTTGVDDFTSFSCNPFTCKCYCGNPPPPNCLPDHNGQCDTYCKSTYCGNYFGILCGSYDNPVCTCACNPYGPYLRNASISAAEAPMVAANKV